jgi:hypothetical protein
MAEFLFLSDTPAECRGNCPYFFQAYGKATAGNGISVFDIKNFRCHGEKIAQPEITDFFPAFFDGLQRLSHRFLDRVA